MADTRTKADLLPGLRHSCPPSGKCRKMSIRCVREIIARVRAEGDAALLDYYLAL